MRYVGLSILLVAVFLLSACQLDANRRFSLLAFQAETPTPTLTATPTATYTPSPSPTNTPLPTNTPTPTATPVPGERLAQAERAYHNGDYETARAEFDALLKAPHANEHERKLALHWRGRSELQLGQAAAAIATLKMFVMEYPSDTLTRAAQFNMGVAYEQAGQFQEAILTYRGAIIPDDPINAYIYQRIGDAGLQTTAYTDTITAYQTGIDATDDPGFKVRLHESIAQVELKRDNPAGAIAQYEAILNTSQTPDYRAKILKLAGEAHLAAGEPEKAYERYLEAVNLYPEASDSYLALIELVDAEVPVDEFQRGLVDYYAGAYQAAIAAFERYLNPDPVLATATTGLTTTGVISSTASPPAPVEPTAPPRAADAIWYTGRSWQALGQYNSAIINFSKLIDDYPNYPEWGRAHLEIGRALVGQDNISRAKAAYREFAAQNPNHPLASEALWLAARLELDGDLLTEAHDNLRDLARTYPNSEYADDALYWAGRAALIDKDYEKAIAAWTELVDNYPDSDLVSFGNYWHAKALITLEREDEAKAILRQMTEDTTDYYNLRARDLLSGQQPGPVPLKLPSPAELAQEQVEAEAWLREWLDVAEIENLAELSSQVRSDPAFQRGDELLNIGLRDEALAEFETVKDDWWNNALAMYQLSLYFRDMDLNQLSIVSAARLSLLSPANTSEKAPIFIQRLLYPIYFADLVFGEAEQHDLDPALILAIMRQESLFERSAVSAAGARGLMQVMPATGEYIVERGDFGSYNPEQLWLPFLSVKYGAWYIDQQLGIFEGNQFAALAAYNAGPGNVLEWIKNSDDLDTFVESIPFWESRLYIRTIYVNLSAYRRIYGDHSAVPIEN